MSEPAWTLHPQLAADTTCVGELALSRLVAINAADYPWLILVPRRAGAIEIADLGSDAFALMAEIALVSLALKELTRCDKSQCRGDRQCGAAASRPHRRAPAHRSAVAEAGLRRHPIAARRRGGVRAVRRQGSQEAAGGGGGVAVGWSFLRSPD